MPACAFATIASAIALAVYEKVIKWMLRLAAARRWSTYFATPSWGEK